MVRTIPRPPRCRVTWGYHGLTPKVALGESGKEKNSKFKKIEGGGYRSDTSCVAGHIRKL